jgi:hypothetical protein
MFTKGRQLLLFFIFFKISPASKLPISPSKLSFSSSVSFLILAPFKPSTISLRLQPLSSLESKNYTSKIIPKVEKDNGEIVTDQKEILKEVQYFYENLYKNKDEDKGCSLKDIVEGLKGASIRKLTEEGPYLIYCIQQ